MIVLVKITYRDGDVGWLGSWCMRGESGSVLYGAAEVVRGAGRVTSQAGLYIGARGEEAWGASCK